MPENLFAELTRIGVDEELAAKVSASLDPEYNASKKDILVMQEAIMQVQLRSDTRYHELNQKIDSAYHELNQKIDNRYHALDQKIDNRYHELDQKIDSRYLELNQKIDSVQTGMHQGFAELRTEMAGMSRQYLITFGGLITTIITVFLVNLYFHL